MKFWTAAVGGFLFINGQIIFAFWLSRAWMNLQPDVAYVELAGIGIVTAVAVSVAGWFAILAMLE